MKKLRAAMLLGCLYMCVVSKAQDTLLQRQYEEQSVASRAFDDSTWKKATEGLDYTDHRKKKPEAEAETAPLSKPSSFSVSEQTLRLIAFVILFAILILILLRAFGVNISLGKKKKKTEQQFSLAEFDDWIPESELDRFLREALERNDYRLAVRIYYLMVLKELSGRKMISWRKEKTNYDYLAEMRTAIHYGGFRDITLIFERSWYGERFLDKNNYEEASQRFENFLVSLKAT
jgi:hypothetical protein